MEPFSVTTTYFSLYVAFKIEAEKLGWEYRVDFTEFTEENMKGNNSFYFCIDWDDNGSDDYSFSLTNSSINRIYLEKEWDKAVNLLKQIQQKPVPSILQPISVTLKEIANWKQCDVNQLSIIA